MHCEKRQLIQLSHIEVMLKKNNSGISAKISPCIIVANDIIFVLGNKSTIAPINKPHKIAGK
jgi:hypothetical protein